MKEQYVGDVNDYRKYALLRLLGRSGLKLGVCWMLTPDDGSTDGAKRRYLDDPGKFERYDPELFKLLRRVKDEPGTRRLVLIESSDSLSKAVFINTTVPEGLFDRQMWFRQAGKVLEGTDLVFFDPDNGIEVPSVEKGRRKSSKYVYRDELTRSYAGGHSLLIYQHYPHKPRDAFIRDTAADLVGLTGLDAEVWAFRTKDVVFMLVIQPRHHATLSGAAHHIRETVDPDFLNAQLIAAASP